MSSLHMRQVVVGITGGIAAYKSAELVRRLRDRGAVVRVVMTRAAQSFITPLTLQALSGHPVHTELLDTEAEAGMGHIELARWADLVLVAPASADFLARLAQGKGDDLLATLCLATRSPIAIAPAMNQGMWDNPATQDNLALLKGRGIHQFGPGEGSQACGDVGPGRMLEANALCDAAESLFNKGVLCGRRVVVSAGPTREAIDPVRYISNRSSGKMGFALARAASEAGASVVLISGPVDLPPPERVEIVKVTSAQEMHAACLKAAKGCDLFIAAAAVADFRPQHVADQKLKKRDGVETLVLELVRNPDIVADVAKLEPKPFVVGFAAETQALETHAQQKLSAKSLDAIVANDVSRPDRGFDSDNNAVTLIWPTSQESLPLASKLQLATELIHRFAGKLNDGER